MKERFIENIEFAKINEDAFVVYYIRDFDLYKAETVDFNTWTEIAVNLPEQNITLGNVMIGKMNDNYVLVYDTNELAGIYAMKKYMLSTDLTSFDEITISNVRGDVIANNGKIFVLTSSDIYMVKSNAIAPILESKNLLNEKNSVITTNNGDFKWVRDNGVKLYCNKTGDWTEVVNSDNFLTSHFINGNANYQIIWTGEYYIVRPTDYDNGYNPTGAKGNIEIYDAEFNHIKSAELDNYILQMSYVDGKCYVLTDSNIVLHSDTFDMWYANDSNELPLDN